MRSGSFKSCEAEYANWFRSSLARRSSSFASVKASAASSIGDIDHCAKKWTGRPSSKTTWPFVNIQPYFTVRSNGPELDVIFAVPGKRLLQRIRHQVLIFRVNQIREGFDCSVESSGRQSMQLVNHI